MIKIINLKIEVLSSKNCHRFLITHQRTDIAKKIKDWSIKLQLEYILTLFYIKILFY